MKSARYLHFAPFCLDRVGEQLCHGTQLLPLRRKPFAVLRYLVEHAGQVVTKETLLDAVWPDVQVGEGVLTVDMRELRKVLGDNARAPRFIETVHGRGYRFIAPVTTAPLVQGSRFKVQSSHSAIRNLQSTIGMVGREAELAQLHEWLEKALNGERQLVFITGEPGIGKTTIVEAFLRQIVTAEKVWIGRGQCIEHYGAGEAYMPVLEALGRLCRESGGERLIELLSRHAPTWLVQMPALLTATELEALQRKTQGATRERMLREMAEAMEALTAERPLVLRLEDLHWSDVSTLELLSALARRQEVSRLLVLGTYRPVEMLTNGHPLRTVKQELQLHRQCEELRLGFLTEQNIAEYLVSRFAGGTHGRAPLQRLARAIHQRTDGNPLFMVNIVNDLLARGELGSREVEVSTPPTIRQMIERHFDHLNPAEQRVLGVASVVGAEFSTAAVAVGIETTPGEVEALWAGLARREQFLRACGVSEWPDGTAATRYSFLHALYQEVGYERVPVGQRIDLHRRIGEREEQAYGEHAPEIAAELAVHFERGHNYAKAVHYLQQAGENALRRCAHVEAISHLTKGLELLKTLPDTLERAQQELTLQLALGPALIATKGQAAPETGAAFRRACELCQHLGDSPQLFPALAGLRRFYSAQVEFHTTRTLAQQMLTVARRARDPALLVEAHRALGATLFWLGEFALARVHLARSTALYDPQQHHSLAFLYGLDPGVQCRNFAAHVLWLLGYPAQALKRSREALTLARELVHPHSLAFTLVFAAFLHQFRREVEAVQERAEATIVLSIEHGFSYWLAVGTILRGWALAEQGQGEEGIIKMRQGLAAWQATGAELIRPYYLAILAEAYGKAGQTEEGLNLLSEALAAVEQSGERWWEAELYRLKGQLTLQLKQVRGKSKASHGQVESNSEVANTQHPAPNLQAEAEAEACFHKAIEIARQQQAKSLELRAVMSLSRLWQQQGKREKARQILAKIYEWFTEGFDTKDLEEARVLLEALN